MKYRLSGHRAAAALSAAMCCGGFAVMVHATNAPFPTVEPVPADGNLPLNSALYAMSLDFGDLARYGTGTRTQRCLAARLQRGSQAPGASVPFCYIYHARVPYDKATLLKADADSLRPRMSPADFN